ncbi:MAG TPA: TlyA family RNA methyltransferase [Terriglobales bacterium]|nr:TlyA family RNA methyltransferase [Terriglobales bacterium]
MKIRIDKLLVERGLAPSRERAQALILAGKVLANEQKIEKAGASVPDDSTIRLLGQDIPYVSRGGLKIEKALAHWNINVHGRSCLDVGASTGGFTDCLLQHGAERVIAIDTGYGQIDMKLRNNARVRLLEKTNARYLKAADIAPLLEDPDSLSRNPITFIAMDVSFISATLVLPAVVETIKALFNSEATGPREFEAVILVKPQFEVGRELVGRGGIVRDEQARSGAVEKVQAAIRNLGATETDVIDSPIPGAEGNREFLLYAKVGR